MVEAADAEEEEEGGEGGRVLPFNLSCSPVIFYSTNSIAAGLQLLRHWKLTFSFSSSSSSSSAMQTDQQFK